MGILDCKVEPLRFKVGDCVQACIDVTTELLQASGDDPNPGLWRNGTVVETWTGGYPYAIELDTEPGTYSCLTWSWAPMDTDMFVRKRLCHEPSTQCGCL